MIGQVQDIISGKAWRGGVVLPFIRWARDCAVVGGCVVSLCSAAHAVDVPSGQQINLSEVLVDEQSTQTWLRFRFLAPKIAVGEGQLTYSEVEGDFQHLCDKLAVPYIAEFELSGDVVVISMADRDVPFGQTDPDSIQYFEAFRVKDGACVWEEF